MPYISTEKRRILDPVVDDLITQLRGMQLDDPEDNPEGNINYVITKVLDKMYNANYREIVNATGILTSCLLEYYRRMATPIEDQRIYENDDVYENIPGQPK